ncbi:MAG TPA: hypothetical protein VIX59_01400 [Candidatus Binataceae bacterium]
MEHYAPWQEHPYADAEYEYHTRPAQVVKLILSEYCESIVNSAVQFLRREKAGRSLALPVTGANPIHYDKRPTVWVAANHRELYKLYPNQWILVEGESVTAHSIDPHKVEAAAQQRGIVTAFITKVVRPSKPKRMIYAGQIL